MTLTLFLPAALLLLALLASAAGQPLPDDGTQRSRLPREAAPDGRNEAAIAARVDRRKKQRHAPFIAALAEFADPKSVVMKVKERRSPAAAEEGPGGAGSDGGERGPTLRISPRSDEPEPGARLFPAEILIEVLDPRPGCRYSVTVESPGRYTGSAMLVAPPPAGPQFSWTPTFADRYHVVVHELSSYGGVTPLIAPPQPVAVEETGPAGGTGAAWLEERLANAPPCQTQRRMDLFSRWEGDWLGPEFGLEDLSLRTGWSFLPGPRMGCRLETFTSEEIRSLPDRRSIYILGRSVERGVFLSLVDLMLDKAEKKHLNGSPIGKCWGRASVRKGNLEVTYQDFRASSFEDPNEPRLLECHNDKLVKEAGASFIVNASAVWREMFDERPEERWPAVVFLTTALGAPKFRFEHHVRAFVAALPPTWRGTLFLGDPSFSARDAGLGTASEYQSYLERIRDMLRQLSDPRVRWLDGAGISKEMRRHGSKGEEYVAQSQHFHHFCFRKDPNNRREAMAVCSNVTEMVGQLLLGHALGPKQEFLARAATRQSRAERAKGTTWCHACPPCLLPFHLTPHPQMQCVQGPIVGKAAHEDCGGKRSSRGRPSRELTCPASCLETAPVSEFGSESDTVYVRQCALG